MEAKLITLTTDFGYKDPFVGIIKGVIFGINPNARMIDLSHGIPPQDLMCGALVLSSSVPYFPQGTIHMAVVDPGVGGARKPILIETQGQVLIGPDNGLLEPSARAGGAWRGFCLTNPRFHLTPVSQTFHGRDIFAPAAAHLSLGVPPETFGPPLTAICSLDLPRPEWKGKVLAGNVIYVDAFSNLITNIPFGELQGRKKVTLRIKSREIHGLVQSYEDVPPGNYLAIIGSWGVVEIAQREGRAGDSLKAGQGERVEMELQE
jgi:S-adenosylmethionine hydrolase